MTTEVEICTLLGCIHNERGLCLLAFITLDDHGTCDQKATQEPLPEPLKPERDPRP